MGKRLVTVASGSVHQLSTAISERWNIAKNGVHSRARQQLA
jgi:hypothetical protein